MVPSRILSVPGLLDTGMSHPQKGDDTPRRFEKTGLVKEAAMARDIPGPPASPSEHPGVAGRRTDDPAQAAPPPPAAGAVQAARTAPGAPPAPGSGKPRK